MSRQPAAALGIVCSALVLLAATGGAECAVATASPADDLEGAEATGAQALMASAAYPGLGQLLNGSEVKSVVIGAAEAYLIGLLVLEDRWTRHSFRRYRETGKRSYYEDYERHFDSRQTAVWWLIVVALYSVTDAYVDAQLSRFDEPVSPYIEASPDRWGEGGIRLGVCWSF